MKSIKNPNPWSCLPASFSIALDMPVKDVLDFIGHDGSSISFPELPEPLCRRGFHPQEFVKLCLHKGKAATRVEIVPVAYSALNKCKAFNIGGWEWFNQNLFNSSGVIECRTHKAGHAMAYEGKTSHALICDPGNKGEIFEFHTPSDAEKRNRFLVALWRLDTL